MAKSAAQIDREIDALLETRRPKAVGIWWWVRRMIERNGGKFPGDLRTPNGAAIPAGAIGECANAPAAAVLSCLQQLEAKGLLKQLDDGTWHSPFLARFQEARKGERTRKTRERERKGVTSHPKRCDIGVTSGGSHTGPSAPTQARPH